jgi:Tfp pilus assembly protein FimT
MVVVGIIAGTAVVSLSGTTGKRSAMAARQLQRDMTYARQRAVATGTRSWLDLNTGAQTWTVRVEDTASPGRATSLLLTDPSTGGDFVQALNTGTFLGVTMTVVDFDSEDWIGFDWLGRPLDETGEATPFAAHGSVTFSGGETVTVDKDTGHIAFVPAP